ncbi:U-scoloptoxin(20)-Cw1a-like [Calliopsis andreniformis]|uniref:U-scoloptoxin(20)-Cw1a-like n=1 Tax=Calliopsis andreniformis TaxID=337506 RepID=UPI003FCD75E3
MKMNCTCVILFLAVCALWTFGETLSCDQCGRECADICGTRQFRACCFNNMKKRQFDGGMKLWMKSHMYTIRLHPDQDIQY